MDHGWVMNKTAKMIILLEFQRTSDTSKNVSEGMKRRTDNQHTPILVSIRCLARDRDWTVESVPWSQRSVKKQERLETLKVFVVFGINTEDGT